MNESNLTKNSNTKIRQSHGGEENAGRLLDIVRSNKSNENQEVTDEGEGDDETVNESFESDDVTWKPRVVIFSVRVKINIVEVSEIVNKCKRIMQQIQFFGQIRLVGHI